MILVVFETDQHPLYVGTDGTDSTILTGLGALGWGLLVPMLTTGPLVLGSASFGL